jgi:hypothetical protein
MSGCTLVLVTRYWLLTDLGSIQVTSHGFKFEDVITVVTGKKVKFVVNKISLQQVFLLVLLFSPY